MRQLHSLVLATNGGGSSIMWQEIEKAIQRATGRPFHIVSREPVGGGCINEALRLRGSSDSFFLKLNSHERLTMFSAEAAGLELLRASGAIRAPQPIAWGISGERSWLVLEYLDLQAPDASSSERLGEQLAAMHRFQAPQFGWERDNTIGATPQQNPWADDWPTFFAEHRIGAQLLLAAQKGAGKAVLEKGARLRAVIPQFFNDYSAPPSLLHGDLWSGNWGADGRGRPVLFDPAVYYGDREADIAMTELFGGFDERFYQAYNTAWPLDAGYRVRRRLYNLYHVLNHFNLFGGAYEQQAVAIIEALLAER